MLIWDWIKSKLFHETIEVKPMSEPIIDTVGVGANAPVPQPQIISEPAAPTPVIQTVTINAVEADLDAFAAKVKALLLVAGHDVESKWAELIALAKKI